MVQCVGGHRGCEGVKGSFLIGGESDAVCRWA